MKSISSFLSATVKAVAETYQTKHESPIEGILCTALYRDLGYRRGPGVFDRSIISNLREAAGGTSAGWVFTQHQIGRYRADLLIVAVPSTGSVETLVVECDGKDFHSSTTQIADDIERAAEIRRVGYRLIRFSGSDIYRATDFVLREIVWCLGEAGASICKETGKSPRPNPEPVDQQEEDTEEPTPVVIDDDGFERNWGDTI
jgi:very-short-patch-repair endonuclease